MKRKWRRKRVIAGLDSMELSQSQRQNQIGLEKSVVFSADSNAGGRIEIAPTQLNPIHP
jgi:hypothetical protein